MKVIPIHGPAAPSLAPDIVWNGATGSLVITGPNDPVNPSGLRAREGIATAVLICLMTDARCEPYELRDGDVNRGWPGDAFDMEPGEVPLGSKLWLLRRRALTPGIELEAEDYARAAMQTLIDQGVFVRVDVKATANRAANRLDLDVVGYGRAGEQKYAQKFGVLWEQI